MSWTTPTPTGIRNVHTRVTAGPLERAGNLLARVADADTRLWPTDRWPPLILDQGLTPGSRGGHGPIRYRVTEYLPDERVAFSFTPDSGLSGGHALNLAPVGTGVLWTHELIIDRPSLMVRALVLRLHDQLMEDLLDNAEAALGDRPVTRRPMTGITPIGYAIGSIRQRLRSAAQRKRAEAGQSSSTAVIPG